MPLDVIMPALGMAQDTGLIVAWHKQPGDAVAKGDVLFEVETDKATMDVEAQGDGFLIDVAASEGTDVPVGDVIAKISETAENTAPAANKIVEPDTQGDDLPTGKNVIMPTLGMAQDTGLLVTWRKSAGDALAADDVLFEVETDKSTVEVTAGADGYLAAILASEGEDVPVGQTIAIISADAPVNPMTRSAASTPENAASGQEPEAPKKPEPAKKATGSPLPATGDRILASPKLRRLAREQGFDLGRLVTAGFDQPFHVKDLDALKALHEAGETNATPVAQAASRIVADITTIGFTDLAEWAADTANLTDATALLAGLCAASLGKDAIVAVESFGVSKTYAATTQLSATTDSADAAQIRIRDLRFTPITTVQVGAGDVPTLTLTRNGAGLTITLEYANDALSATDAITLLSNFAGRVEQPLRHLL